MHQCMTTTELTLAKPFHSIRQLPGSVSLPSFTLITGLNGAGKSHLLSGIMAGHITAFSDGHSLNVQTDIKHATWAELAPQDNGPFSESTIDQERHQLATAIVQQAQQFRDALLQQAIAGGMTGAPTTDVRLLLALPPEGYAPLLNGSVGSPPLHQQLHANATAWNAKLVQNHAPDAAKKALCRMAETRAGLPLIALEVKDFANAAVANWGTSEIFQHQFGRAFSQYRALERTNRSLQFDQLQKKPADGVMTDGEFRGQHGEPPWDFVNTAMQDAGLDFVINAPDRHAPGMFEPHLTKRSTGAEIKFSALSSGEKVLMSLALSLYYAADKRTLASYPKLLLLDEIDAPLHPSMSAHLIRIIEKTLVGRHGIHVIATTHSPATVALGPETAIHVMDATRPGVHKTSKAQALNILMRDVPTLALSHDGRRQVFVESKIDAEIYGVLWQALKPKIAIDRSLEFIAPGIRSPQSGSDVHNGCAVVEHLIKELSAAGVSSAFGLIDWDKKNTAKSRIIIPGHGVRYGLENLLLDPRLLGALLLHTTGIDTARRAKLGLTGLTYSTYCALQASSLQPIVTTITHDCFGEAADAEVDVTYVDGMTLKISAHFLAHTGHKLAEEILPTKYPWLKCHGTRNGDLIKHTAVAIGADAPNLLPRDVLTAFETIIEAAAH
jgi:ABC-type branched-subunit amino acid transport system ATPase component